MARSKQRHVLKRRRYRSFDRSVDTRDVYKEILIVCEGKKTEPNYFTGLAAYLRVLGVRALQLQAKSTPKEISRVAFEELSKNPDDYQAVFCVYDVDHDSKPMMASAADAAQFIKKRPKFPEVVFMAIPSTPCFEIWLLLHFVKSDKPYQKTAAMAAQYQLLRDLKAHLPKYEKGRPDIFEYVRQCAPDGLATALANAKWLCARTKNPYTLIHEVVGYISERKT